jgi:predicted alpha/beta superfamily hydrolase
MKVRITTLPIPTEPYPRTIRILLPDDFEEVNRTYRVLYMHDGQNLFDDHIAYGGHSWGIKEIIEDLKITDLIVVGLDNSDLRFFEYSPWKSVPDVRKITAIDMGGLGDIYASWVSEQVVPYIDHHYPTKKSAQNRMIAGSSMGGYISAYIAAKYPDIFSIAGIFSLASWFNEPEFLRYIGDHVHDSSQRFFISVGSHETSNPNDLSFNQLYLDNSRRLRDLLKDKGIKDIFYIETEDVHNELAWRKVFPSFVTWAQK